MLSWSFFLNKEGKSIKNTHTQENSSIWNDILGQYAIYNYKHIKVEKLNKYHTYRGCPTKTYNVSCKFLYGEVSYIDEGLRNWLYSTIGNNRLWTFNWISILATIVFLLHIVGDKLYIKHFCTLNIKSWNVVNIYDWQSRYL